MAQDFMAQSVLKIKHHSIGAVTFRRLIMTLVAPAIRLDSKGSALAKQPARDARRSLHPQDEPPQLLNVIKWRDVARRPASACDRGKGGRRSRKDDIGSGGIMAVKAA
jgi:hypothetical protein